LGVSGENLKLFYLLCFNFYGQIAAVQLLEGLRYCRYGVNLKQRLFWRKSEGATAAPEEPSIRSYLFVRILQKAGKYSDQIIGRKSLKIRFRDSG
jgi:hypothetical protein